MSDVVCRVSYVVFRMSFLRPLLRTGLRIACLGRITMQTLDNERKVEENRLKAFDKETRRLKEAAEARITNEEDLTEALNAIDEDRAEKRKKLDQEVSDNIEDIEKRRFDAMKKIKLAEVKIEKTSAIAAVKFPRTKKGKAQIADLTTLYDKLIGLIEAQAFKRGGISAGGPALVGEEGPELVNLPKGAQVFSNAETRSMLSGGSGGSASSTNRITNNDLGKNYYYVFQEW